MGPLAGEGEPLPLDLSLQLEDIPMAAAGSYLEDYLETGGTGGMLQLSLQVSGSPPEAFDATGKLELQGVQVQVPGLDGTARSVSLHAGLDYDIGYHLVAPQLRLRVESPPGVVEIDLIVGVESAVLGGPQLIEYAGRLEFRMRLLEGGQNGAEVGRISDSTLSHKLTPLCWSRD